jgi:hypothetical protein
MIIKCPVCGEIIKEIPDTANDTTNIKYRCCDACWKRIEQKKKERWRND